MALQPTRNANDLHELPKHLLYDIEMMGAITEALATVVPSDRSHIRTALREAPMESWALHVRNPLSFLSDNRAGKETRSRSTSSATGPPLCHSDKQRENGSMLSRTFSEKPLSEAGKQIPKRRKEERAKEKREA